MKTCPRTTCADKPAHHVSRMRGKEPELQHPDKTEGAVAESLHYLTALIADQPAKRPRTMPWKWAG